MGLFRRFYAARMKITTRSTAAGIEFIEENGGGSALRADAVAIFSLLEIAAMTTVRRASKYFLLKIDFPR